MCRIVLIFVCLINLIPPCFASELDLSNLDIPWGGNVKQVSKEYDLGFEQKSSIDTTYSICESHFGHKKSINGISASTKFEFYNGRLHSVKIYYEKNDTTEVIKMLTGFYDLPYKDILDSYWFPTSDEVIIYSQLDATFKIMSIAEELTRCDLKRDERKKSALKKNRYDVRKAIWGMTEDEIREIEKQNPIYEYKLDGYDIISTSDNLFYDEIGVHYWFLKNRLIKVTYMWRFDYPTRMAFVKEFNSIQKNFTAKYGPTYNGECIPDSIKEDDLKLNSGYYVCIWNNKPKIFNNDAYDSDNYDVNNSIVLILRYGDSGINISAEYSGNIYTELENYYDAKSKFEKF